MQPRICIIADAVDEQSAGIHVYATQLITELSRQTAGRYQLLFVHLHPNPFFEGLMQKIIPLNRRRLGATFFRKLWLLPEFLHQQKFDLVHDLSHFAPQAFARFPGKKIVTIHDLTAISHPHYQPRQSALGHRLVIPRVLRHSDLLLAVSQHAHHQIQQYFPHHPPIQVTPLAGRILPEPASISSWPRPYFLFVGTLEPRKNITGLLTAYEGYRALGGMADLVLVGQLGWRTGPFVQQLNQSKYAADIHRIGYVDTAHLSNFYAHAIAFLFPSHHEGFGLPVLEAMQSQTAVISSAAGGLAELVCDAALVLSPTDHIAWSRAMRHVESDPALRQDLQRRGAMRARQYSWQKTAAQTLAAYDQLLQ